MREVRETVRHQAPPAVLRAESNPEPEPAPLPEIHVTHDRKQHHAISGEGSAQPRKATSEDFLTPSTPLASNTGISHPDNTFSTRGAFARGTAGKSSGSPAQPVSVVSVVRSTEPRPQLVPVNEQALEPILLPTLYNKRGHLIMPPPLKGSHEILIHQNEVADREGLDRVRDDEDLRRLRESRMLVSVSESSAIVWDDRLPYDRRYVRPWTAQFLTAMSRAHYARFRTPLQINSGVRTVEFQQHLLRVNGNAAPAGGDTASPHLTGQAVDLAKHGLSMAEIAWMRSYLMPLVQQGKVDVEEEFQQSCFHISVYKTYVPFGPIPRTIQTNHRAMALAAAME